MFKESLTRQSTGNNYRTVIGRQCNKGNEVKLQLLEIGEQNGRGKMERG